MGIFLHRDILSANVATNCFTVRARHLVTCVISGLDKRNVAVRVWAFSHHRFVHFIGSTCVSITGFLLGTDLVACFVRVRRLLASSTMNVLTFRAFKVRLFFAYYCIVVTLRTLAVIAGVKT